MKKDADSLLDDVKREQTENSAGIVYLISNVDTLKYLSLGNPIDERREAIIRHVLDLYPSTNKSTIKFILTKNKIFSNELFVMLSSIPTLLAFFISFYFFYTSYTLCNYNPEENPILNVIGICFMYVLPSVAVAVIIKGIFLYICFSTPLIPRIYGIKPEYKKLGIPTKKLYEIK